MAYHYASYVIICKYCDCYYYSLPILPLLFQFVFSYYSHGVPLCIICHYMSISWLVLLRITIIIVIICFDYYYYGAPPCNTCHHMSMLWLLLLQTTIIINIIICFFITLVMMHHCASYVLICQQHGCYYYTLPFVLPLLLVFVLNNYDYGVSLSTMCDYMSAPWLLSL